VADRAREFGQPYSGTEHILFAFESKNARANTLLKEIQIDPTAIRDELEHYLVTSNTSIPATLPNQLLAAVPPQRG